MLGALCWATPWEQGVPGISTPLALPSTGAYFGKTPGSLGVTLHKKQFKAICLAHGKRHLCGDIEPEPTSSPWRMDGVWTGNTFSLNSCPVLTIHVHLPT